MGKLKQANPVKFYLAKYIILAIALLQLLVATTLFYSTDHTPRNNAIFFLFVCLGSLFMVLYFYLQSTLKRVAVGKHKIVVMQRKNKIEFRWPEVKSIRLLPFFNLYKIVLKEDNQIIYFFPSKNIEPAYDLLAQDTSKMGSIVSKRKRELGI